MDNLSGLPDELVLCIISLLPMEDAVRTSVLSKRWRYLYASRSNLEFSFGQDEYAINVPLIDAMNIVDRVFHYRNRCSSSINSFHISWDYRDAFDPLRLQGWINYVMCQGIQKIGIRIPANFLLPASLFTCETLVELHLGSGPIVDVPTKVFLPNLKVLELTDVISFPYDDVASERLLTNCPVLEDFNYSFRDGDCKLIVFHPTLKHLTITSHKKFGSRGTCVWINAPSLVYFEYFGFDVDSYTLINAQNLTEADIYFQSWFDNELYTLCATNLMRGISHVHKLTISLGPKENLVDNHVDIPVFNNLTHLEFSYIFGEDSRFAFILYFLESLNSLETLCFMELPHVFILDAWYAVHEEATASCLSFRLKRIDISSFHGSDDEMDMVEYLLKKASVLEVLDVGTSDIESSEKQLDVCKRLRMLPIASIKCNVMIS